MTRYRALTLAFHNAMNGLISSSKCAIYIDFTEQSLADVVLRCTGKGVFPGAVTTTYQIALKDYPIAPYRL